jgi:hypothetical protein
MGKYAKLAYDFNPRLDQRMRLSGSVYQVDHSDNPRTRTTPGATRNILYSGNRSGSPYKGLFNADTDAGQILPSTSQDLYAYMFNLFWQQGKAELFLTYDMVSDKDSDGSDSPAKLTEAWSQYAIDFKYNFTPKFYGALRYNVANHLTALDKSSDEKVTRHQGAVGYFLNPSILMKLEYVYQKYDDFQNKLKDGKFHGVVFEGSVGF